MIKKIFVLIIILIFSNVCATIIPMPIILSKYVNSKNAQSSEEFYITFYLQNKDIIDKVANQFDDYKIKTNFEGNYGIFLIKSLGKTYKVYKLNLISNEFENTYYDIYDNNATKRLHVSQIIAAITVILTTIWLIYEMKGWKKYE